MANEEVCHWRVVTDVDPLPEAPGYIVPRLFTDGAACGAPGINGKPPLRAYLYSYITCPVCRQIIDKYRTERGWPAHEWPE